MKNTLKFYDKNRGKHSFLFNNFIIILLINFSDNNLWRKSKKEWWKLIVKFIWTIWIALFHPCACLQLITLYKMLAGQIVQF